jgi:hypothetical protein
MFASIVLAALPFISGMWLPGIVEDEADRDVATSPWTVCSAISALINPLVPPTLLFCLQSLRPTFDMAPHSCDGY